MSLDNMAIAIRSRTPWQAVDLGFVLAREWWWPIMRAWLAVFIPIALVLALVLHRYPLWLPVVIWWLKPLYDRVVMHVLGEAMFGSIPTLRQTLRALPGVLRHSGLIASLTWRRPFNFARTFHLPVWQLEKSRGAFARARIRALNQHGGNAVASTMLVLAHLEVILQIGLLILITMLWPGESDTDFSLSSFFYGEASPWEAWLSFSLYLIVVSIIEPLFVAVGFALYLNARNAIEGWDVELALRQMAQRLRLAQSLKVKNTAPGAPALQNTLVCTTLTILVLSLATLSGGGLSEAVAAAPSLSSQFDRLTGKPEATPTNQHESEERKKIRAALQEVMSDPAFGYYQQTQRLKYIGPKNEKDEKDKKREKDSYPMLEKFVTFIAESARIIGWIAAILVAALLLYLAVRHFGQNGKWSRGKKRVIPQVLFGLDVRPDSLPDDVAARARQYLDEGNARAALSLLYRAALVRIIHEGRVEIASGDTEGLCVWRVRQAYRTPGLAVEFAEYFAQLVEAWRIVAYARQSVADARVHALIAQWRRFAAAQENHTALPPAEPEPAL